jgi:uncharacterized protein (TIGR02466 family)
VPKIYEIFPTQLYISELVGDLSKEELDFINSHKTATDDVGSNYNNSLSENKYILESPELARLKEEIQQNLNLAFEKLIDPKTNVKSVLTQSWLNFNEQGESHHTHRHPNSFLSGVVYINFPNNLGEITFYNDSNDMLYVEPKNITDSNTKQHTFHLREKYILIFPSSLRHGVKENSHKETRISLAFNSFLEGEMGSYLGATELIVKGQ